jgi:hypothetical protein
MRRFGDAPRFLRSAGLRLAVVGTLFACLAQREPKFDFGRLKTIFGAPVAIEQVRRGDLMIRHYLFIGLLAAWSSPILNAAHAQQASTPGQIRTDSTPGCISIEWDVTGDSDHDATCSVEYRKNGASEWKEALPLFRVDYRWWYHTERAERPFNLFAGSILFLEPDTAYDVRLDLVDPDGGKSTQLVAVTTRPTPALPQNGRTLQVMPGAGGGEGTKADPYRGLATAQEAADPGDILLLHKGNYGSFVFEKSGEPGKYLAWKADDSGEAVFSAVRVKANHLWFEGLRLQRKDEPNGLRALGGASDVVVRRNVFNGFHYSITLNRTSRYWYITDNVIVGDNDPVTGGIGGEGIELSHSSGHVVAHNDISRVADGVSYPERNCDIYGNDIHDVSDDGLEPDYGKANVRMWGNRIYNYHFNALSFQPMHCGPWYFIRNQVIGSGGIFKFRVQDRFVLVNNTFVKWGSMGNRMHHILSSFSRNNLYISADGKGPIWAAIDCRQPQYCLPNIYKPRWMTDVDRDGFDWGASPQAFRWENNKHFPDLKSFSESVGIEKNALRVKKEAIFQQWNIPAEPAPVSAQHLTLRAGSAAVDAGAVVPNIGEDYVGKAPDLGAYEFGQTLPCYGPRPN